ncbi:beta-phosphoglucomutase family hydrolase [Arthrobacter sp. I2-34]|uniref:Beta-phosphoglucomutase family hydrolase n=1 Tax=Arthrobacter hankyongi TaxID=2904801 RepID=A0ABS9L661_9MICC|nr:beta-phosphoglucomutase family hydrolase [Arthrobacter hankyongi]MCG2622171.1 beta-phosphoglucomutase family hydrolase [Arthrobacter hankyongi]
MNVPPAYPLARGTLSPTVAGTLSPFDAVIFDLDGVVTNTAAVHQAAWKELFDSVLADSRMPVDNGVPEFADEDYRRYIDGRPREDGVRSFLRSRGIALPEGSPQDTEQDWTVFGLGKRKNRIFQELLRRTGVKAFPSTLELMERLRAARVPLALVTASRNTTAVLAAARLADAFDLVVDGTTAKELNLPGKPDPAMFLEAARRLGLPPARIAVLEDAVAGVQAASRGGFGLVVGIDRAGERTALEDAGAGIVLNDVGELDIGLVLTDPWMLAYEGFDPAHEGHREALTTLGNGYLGTRGAAPESSHSAVHYPGTYLAGVYNRLHSVIQDHATEDEHMVNVSNWLPLDLRTENNRWWSEGGLKLLWERRELDLRRAVLTRHIRLEDEQGRHLELTQRRIVSMAEPHLMALETRVTARGWNGPVSIRSGVDTGVLNANVPQDALLANRHLVPLTSTVTADGIQCVEVETSQSHIRIATAVRTELSEPPAPASVEQDAERSYRRFEVRLADGVPLVITKTAAMATSHDRAISSPLSGAMAVLARSPARFSDMLAPHEAAWRRLERLFAVDLDADPQSRLILNLHVFHLLQTITPHTAGLDVGVPARGLHGEGYRGHIFWDDLFVLPLVTSRLPSVARALLNYRRRRLDAARDAAKAAGLTGAMFPWQSGSDGREETPQWLYNQWSGHWVRDHSSQQRHGGLAVAFNAWQYFEATLDRVWLSEAGAELIVEVARLFAAMAEYDEQADRFHLRAVLGPDEYHDGYPENPGGGLDDNAYTNVMAAWVSERALHILATAPDREDMQERFAVTEPERIRWERVSRRMFVPFHDDGIISQFDGYARLQELDWDRYRSMYGNIERLDLILEAEGDSPNRYRLAKQADVLMLLYILGDEQLIALLARLGYTVTQADLARIVDYYLARTVHGSTLSRVAHASVLAAADPERAWATFREALDADLDDTQGGTTRTGIHLGAMAGSIDVVQRSFAGLRMKQNALVFSPRMPTELRQVRFQVRYRGHLLDISLGHAELTVTAAPGEAAPVTIRVGERTALVAAGQSAVFALPGAA